MSVYPGLFLCPTQEDWTIQNLGAARETFAADEKIAYVLEATSDIPKNDGSVKLLAIVRNADGKLIDFDEQSVVWNDFWSNKKAVSSFPRTPQTAGDYTLEIYVNGKLLTSMTFTVKA